MDYKKIVAEQIHKTISEHLSFEEIYKMIEVPKYVMLYMSMLVGCRINEICLIIQ